MKLVNNIVLIDQCFEPVNYFTPSLNGSEGLYNPRDIEQIILLVRIRQPLLSSRVSIDNVLMAFTFLSIFISVTLIFPYSYSNNREFTAERQINLENVVFDVNVIYNVTVRSLIGCIVHCIQFVNCMSVHFSRFTKECLGVNIGYVVDSVAIGRISSNWSYYLVLDGEFYNI